MKQLFILVLSLVMALSLAACGEHSDSPSPFHTTQPDNEDSISVPPDAEQIPKPEDNASSGDTADDQRQILVAYFSRSGNTEQVALEIQAQTSGTLFEIVPEEPYSEDYDETVERFRREREEDARPALASTVEDMDGYDVVFVGYPIWGGEMPHVVRTFLETYDLNDKTIIPFCTHGGSRFGSSLGTLETLCPGSMILEGYETSGSHAASCGDEVAEWLAEIGIL